MPRKRDKLESLSNPELRQLKARLDATVQRMTEGARLPLDAEIVPLDAHSSSALPERVKLESLSGSELQKRMAHLDVILRYIDEQEKAQKRFLYCWERSAEIGAILRARRERIRIVAPEPATSSAYAATETATGSPAVA